MDMGLHVGSHNLWCFFGGVFLWGPGIERPTVLWRAHLRPLIWQNIQDSGAIFRIDIGALDRNYSSGQKLQSLHRIHAALVGTKY